MLASLKGLSRMEISKSVFLRVFKSNFTYNLVETELGQAVKVPARDAFIYSCVTGAGYLDNPIYLFTPNGLIKLFYNAFNYKFVTGIFSNITLKNTPYIWALAKSYLFNEPKYIASNQIKSKLRILETSRFFESPRTVTETIQQLREYGWAASPLDVSKVLAKMASVNEIMKSSEENRIHYFTQESLVSS